MRRPRGGEVPHNRRPSQGFGCANSRRGTLPRHRECAGWEEATEAKTHSEGISGLAVAGADRAGRKPQPASASSPSLRTLGLHCCTLLRINPSCAGRPTMGILARTKGQRPEPEPEDTAGDTRQCRTATRSAAMRLC
jgi:hypothetical protein